MTTPTLAVYLFGHNLEKIRYPYIASIESALDLVGNRGAVFYAECDSDPDDTAWEQICELRRKHPNLHLLKSKLGEHFSVQAHIANFLLDNIGTDYTFALKLDADEVLCEWTFDEFYKQLEFMQENGWVLGRPRYTHFTPDFDHEFPFCYQSKAVLTKTDSFLRFNTNPKTGNADGCAIGGAREFQTELMIQHFGKVQTGREQEALMKEITFQELYSHDDLGFPDPRVVALVSQGYIDYRKVFEVTDAEGKIIAFNGNHPKYVNKWIEESNLRSIVFWSNIDKSRSAVDKTT